MPSTTVPRPAFRLSMEPEDGCVVEVVVFVLVVFEPLSLFATGSGWPWDSRSLPSLGTMPPPCPGRLPSPVVRPLEPRPPGT